MGSYAHGKIDPRSSTLTQDAPALSSSDQGMNAVADASSFFLCLPATACGDKTRFVAPLLSDSPQVSKGIRRKSPVKKCGKIPSISRWESLCGSTREGLMHYVLALLLVGCATAPPGWTNPTKDRSEWNSDAADCERATADETDATQRELAKIRCMVMKGWRASP